MKKLLGIVGTFITAITVLLFLLSSATAYISPVGFSLSTLLSIAYLPILIVYIIVTAFWFFKSKRIFFALVFLLFAGYKNLLSTVALNVFNPSWKETKEEGTIRIMSWNVNTFGDSLLINDTSNSRRQKMLALIRQVNPDILCIQDLGDKRQTADKRFVQNMEAITQAAGFSSAHYSYFYEFEGHQYSMLGVAIFTKFPIKDTGSIWNDGANRHERTGFIDVMLQGRVVRIINAHLSSMSLWPSPEQQAGINYLEGDSTRIKARSIFHKITNFGEVHIKEAELLKSFINKSPFPVLFCADLNAVPSSYVYHSITTKLQDAFIESDYGIGGTYNRVFPKLRIDVMLHSKEFKTVQFARPAVDLSDHYPIIADIRWKQ